MKQIVLLFTPGLDSYLSNYILSKREDIDLVRLYIDITSRYSKNECLFLRDRYNESYKIELGGKNIIIADHSNIDLDLGRLENHDSYIPNRNLMLVTLASSFFTGADEIYINSMKDDRVSDSNRGLFEPYSKILSKSVGKDVEIKSHFWDTEKGDAILNYLADGGQRLNLLMNTYSCFSSIYHKDYLDVYTSIDTVSGIMYESIGNFHIHGCMECKACFRKACALVSADLYVPFKNNILAESYRCSVDKYSLPVRYENTMKYLKFLEYYEKGK